MSSAGPAAHSVLAPRVRKGRAWIRPAPVFRMRRDAHHCILLQAAGLLPIVCGQEDVSHGGAPRGPRVSRCSVSTMGVVASDAAEISPGVGWRLVSRRACHLPVRRVRVLPRSHSIADGRCGAVTLRQLFGSALDSLMIYSRGHRSRGPRLRRGASVRPPSTYARYAYSRPPVGILGSLGASEALPRATGLIPRPASRTRVRPIDHQAVSANLHFHSLVADGVFAAAGTELGAAGPPSDAGDPVDERRSGRRRHTG